MAKTIGFYQNFNLNLQRLSTALQCIKETPKLSHDELANHMGVNRPVAEGFSAWLTHTGLAIIDVSQPSRSLTYRLTPFGTLASEHDLFLQDINTQWLLHYHLATEHIERSEAWFVFVNHFLSTGQKFSSDQFQSYFANIAGITAKNRSALEKDPTSVLYSYTNLESLNRLGLLRKEKDTYLPGSPNLPHIFIVGYMLFDWWQRRYEKTDTLRFSQLCQEEESLGRLCLADSQQVKRLVIDLANHSLLSFSETQHEPVNRLYHGPLVALLERYYTER